MMAMMPSQVTVPTPARTQRQQARDLTYLSSSPTMVVTIVPPAVVIVVVMVDVCERRHLRKHAE